DLIVARHAHGELVQRYAVRRAVAEPVAEVAKPLEAGADAGRIAGEKRERHQPANAERREGRQRLQEGRDLLRWQAELARLPRSATAAPAPRRRGANRAPGTRRQSAPPASPCWSADARSPTS